MGGERERERESTGLLSWRAANPSEISVSTVRPDRPAASVSTVRPDRPAASVRTVRPDSQLRRPLKETRNMRQLQRVTCATERERLCRCRSNITLDPQTCYSSVGYNGGLL
jgi:hypothetical protein